MQVQMRRFVQLMPTLYQALRILLFFGQVVELAVSASAIH